MKATARRVLIALAGAAVAFALYVVAGIPSRSTVRKLATANPGPTSVMRQREEEAKAAGRPFRVQQTWVPIYRISRHLVHAVLASEDQNFFGHEGVDWEAMEKAFEADRAAGRLARGGSTITQQLAKNLFFTTDRSLIRKAREVVAARLLEDELGKKRILEIYLNVIEWGDGVFGAQAAALRYYGKPASALDEAEAAGLAAMIPNPRTIHPRLAPGRHARAQRRVLWLMRMGGFLKREGGALGAEPPPVDADEETDDPPLPAASPPGPADAPSTPEPAVTEPPSPEASPSP